MTGQSGESSLRASQWNDVLDCVDKLQVFMGKSLHMWLTGFCFVLFFIHVHVRACLCWRGRSRDRSQHTDAPRLWHGLTFSWTPVLLDYQQMEIRGEYAAALLIAERLDLRPPSISPWSWLHGPTSSQLFMMWSAWPRNKRAAACRVIREDWKQLLNLTIQRGAVLLVPFKCDACKIKDI